MASTKMKALIGIGRFLVALVFGFGVYTLWLQNRRTDPQYFSILAGIITLVMAFVMLNTLKGGGD
jgi:hypothetical protein